MLSQGKIGEDWDVNTELTLKIANRFKSNVERRDWINIISPRVSCTWPSKVEGENVRRAYSNMKSKNIEIKNSMGNITEI